MQGGRQPCTRRGREAKVRVAGVGQLRTHGMAGGRLQSLGAVLALGAALPMGAALGFGPWQGYGTPWRA
eukprot:scaffold126615_cov63-Phaeocystis_antarctica.AAC.2